MGQSITILCLGDSLTDGASSTNPAYPYSTEFPQFLQGVEVTNEGHSGWGARDLADELEKSLGRKKQDIVCFMAGTNDLLLTPAAEILETLERAWATALAAGSRVVALTVLEGQISSEFHENQQQLNRLIKASVKRQRNDLLTCFDAAAALPSQEARPDLWGDPVHPRPRGYRMLGEGLAMYLIDLVEQVKGLRGNGRRTQFRPCIDLHAGIVKQIVGGTLSDASSSSSSSSSSAPSAASPDEQAAAATTTTTTTTSLRTNWESKDLSAAHYANLYKTHDLRGGHIIMLGPNCTAAAIEALAAWPRGMQIGGGINDTNAQMWLTEHGAEKVILTSWLFPDGKFNRKRLDIISTLVTPNRLVIDLSCRLNRGKSGWTVAMNKWTTLTDFEITIDNLDFLSRHCSEFLIHAADVEGLQAGVDEHLVEFLGLWAARRTSAFQITYAGGARSLEDLKRVHALSGGLVDLTIGSALDIFGGQGVSLQECIDWNAQK